MTNKFTVTSTKGTISQEHAYRTGNIVMLNFILTLNTTVAAGESFGVTFTVTDNALKPIARQPGSTNSRTVAAVNIDGNNCNAVPTAQMSSTAAFWLTYTYICAGS